jgi:hypothetical protein
MYSVTVILVTLFLYHSMDDIVRNQVFFCSEVAECWRTTVSIRDLNKALGCTPANTPHAMKIHEHRHDINPIERSV